MSWKWAEWCAVGCAIFEGLFVGTCARRSPQNAPFHFRKFISSLSRICTLILLTPRLVVLVKSERVVVSVRRTFDSSGVWFHVLLRYLVDNAPPSFCTYLSSSIFSDHFIRLCVPVVHRINSSLGVQTRNVITILRVRCALTAECQGV